jgi:dienelactone hydrolase
MEGKRRNSAAISGDGPTTERIFDYDQAAPLESGESGTEERNGVVVHDVSFADARGGRASAYWMVPPGRDRFPVVLFVHPAPGDRSTFFDEGIRIGGMGIASLLVEAPWASGEAFARSLGTPEQNRDLFIAIVRDLRRAIDFAAAQPGTDATRIGYVGHSFGALLGGVLVGVEPRIRAFVLMAGAPSFSDVAVANLPSLSGKALEHYRQVMAPIDPIRFVAGEHASSLLLQFGERDELFGREKAGRLADAASQPKLVRWYDTDHYFRSEEAKRDRVEWLQSQLGSGYRRMKGQTGRPPVHRR